MANTTIPSELIAADAITGAKIADNAVDSEHYIDGSIDTAHIADSQVTVGKMAANSVDSDQYVDGSIDTAHIADDQVTLAKMAGLARGKIIVGDSSGNPAALAIGTNGYVLKSDGTDIAWAADADTSSLTSEQVQDIAGAMFSSNTETGITATYQDADGTIDLVVGTLNQDTTGLAGTATALATARTIGGVSFDGSANIDLPGVNTAGNQNVDAALVDGENFKINGGQGSDGQVLTSTGSGVAWEDAAGGAVSAVANGADNRIATFSSSDALNGEANLVFTGSNLGISVASPTAPLDIQSNSSASAVRIRGRSDDIAEVDFYNNANDSVMARFQVDTGYFATHVNGSERMRIDSSGNVGINETAPDFSGFGSNGGGLELDDVGSSFSALRVNQGGTGDFYVAVTTGAAYLWGKANSPTVFGTNNTERLRLDDTGEFLVNRTDGFGAAGAAAMFVTGRSDAAIYVTGANTSGYILMAFLNGGLNEIGSIKNSNNNAVIYATSSDYRLKENVDYTWDATTRLKQLKPARFNWISDPDDTTVDGFLAHEVSSIVPEAIDGVKDATKTSTNCVLNSEGNLYKAGVTEAEWVAGKAETPPKFASDTSWTASHTQNIYQGIDQSKLVPLLVKTIQELEARITVLEG